MAVTSSNSGVLRLVSGDSITDNITVSTMVIVSLAITTGVIDLTLQEGDGSTTICVLAVPPDDSLVIPFGGKGKTFPNGIAFTQANREIVLFLAG